MSLRLAGVDGCRGGWLVASTDVEQTSVSVRVYQTFAEIMAADFAVIAVDMPIGLPDAGARACDIEARRLIGPRRNSVFPCPVRPTLAAPHYSEACEIGLRTDGRKLSKQAWAIVPRINEVDAGMTSADQTRVIEVHPEVCFVGLTKMEPLLHAKKTADGLAMRQSLLARDGLDPTELYAQLPIEAAIDDLHDALAALWTAVRYHRGLANRIPKRPDIDARGLRMEMWY